MNQIRTQFQKALVDVVNNTLAKNTSEALLIIDKLLKIENLEEEDLQLVGELYSWKAWVYAENQEFEAAIKQYNIAKNYPNTPNGHFSTMEGLANACFQSKRLVEGLKHLAEGIMKMEKLELRLKLLEIYYEHCENLKPEFDIIIQELIKYYGLQKDNQPEGIGKQLEWLSETVKNESKSFAILKETLTSLESPTLAIASIHDQILLCQCTYYKNKLSLQKKELEGGLKAYQKLEKEVKKLSEEEALTTLKAYESADHPTFYKRLAQRKIEALTAPVIEEVKEKEVLAAEPIKVAVEQPTKIAVAEPAKIEETTSIAVAQPPEPIIAPIPRPMCPEQPVGYCYCKCRYEKPVKKYIGNTGKYTFVCCSPSGEYCHCKCSYQKLPIKNRGSKKPYGHHGHHFCPYKPVYYCPTEATATTGVTEEIMTTPVKPVTDSQEEISALKSAIKLKEEVNVAKSAVQVLEDDRVQVEIKVSKPTIKVLKDDSIEGKKPAEGSKENPIIVE